MAIWFRPELVKPGALGIILKRLVFNVASWATFPYVWNGRDNVVPVLWVESDNPRRQYQIGIETVLAVHRCLGRVPDDVTLIEHEPMKVAAGYDEGQFTRRRVLRQIATAAPAAALAGVTGGTVVRAALSTVEPDPVFAVIENHRALEAAFVALVAREDAAGIENGEAWGAANDAAEDAAIEILNTPPTTLAGVAAVLAYTGNYCRRAQEWPEIENEDGGWDRPFLAVLGEKLAVAVANIEAGRAA